MNFLANPIIVVNDMARNSGNLSTDTQGRTATFVATLHPKISYLEEMSLTLIILLL